MTGDELFETNIVDIVRQFKENHQLINSKQFQMKRNNNNNFQKGGRGSRSNNF